MSVIPESGPRRVLAAEMEARVLDKTRKHPSRQHPFEHAEASTAPETQSQRYGERPVRTIPVDGHNCDYR